MSCSAELQMISGKSTYHSMVRFEVFQRGQILSVPIHQSQDVIVRISYYLYISLHHLVQCDIVITIEGNCLHFHSRL